MILGWWLMSSVAILTARYYKAVWPDTKIFDKPIWFQVHRAARLRIFNSTIFSSCIVD